MRGHHRRHHCDDGKAPGNAHRHTDRGHALGDRAAAAASDPRSSPARGSLPTRRRHQPAPTLVGDNHHAHATADPHTPCRARHDQPPRSHSAPSGLLARQLTPGAGGSRVRSSPTNPGPFPREKREYVPTELVRVLMHWSVALVVWCRARRAIAPSIGGCRTASRSSDARRTRCRTGRSSAHLAPAVLARGGSGTWSNTNADRHGPAGIHHRTPHTPAAAAAAGASMPTRTVCNDTATRTTSWATGRTRRRATRDDNQGTSNPAHCR
jgi:hypothetical protein